MFLFFCKQKTAYEMRISDWSSDVCSSDLMLEASFGEFAQHSPALYDTLIAERDQYMAARLRETAGDSRDLLAVVGAGHLKGLARHLREDTEAPAAIVERLQALPEKSSIPWFTIAPTLFVLGGFAWGFWHGGADVGTALVLYLVLWTGCLGALHSLVAVGHPPSNRRLFLAPPLPPLHPAPSPG